MMIKIFKFFFVFIICFGFTALALNLICDYWIIYHDAGMLITIQNYLRGFMDIQLILAIFLVLCGLTVSVVRLINVDKE